MNQIELKNILSAKFDFSQWKSLLHEIFGSNVTYFTKEATIDAELIKSGGQVGTIQLDDDRSLAIFKFEVSDSVQIARNRKSLRDIAAKYVDQSLIHGAWVFYYSEKQDDYRLTYIAKQTSFSEEGELVTKETAPKRYTFLLGKNEPCTTAAGRLVELFNKNKTILLADVTEAFSVERLNKEFFAGYKAQYTKFLGQLTDTKSNRDYVKKLLGRLVFLQFLQKKGWMGVPASNDNWEGGDKNYLANLIDRYANNNRLLSDVLKLLFFETLNKSRENDIADGKLGDNIKIPYLNGGLFDKDKLDGLNIDFPYSYFKELMVFFSNYNFTIDENNPDDAEVGIDPEMLGHIFENLLEDNKDKGAFYTPKEIVQYMCRQSLIEYLQSKLGKNPEIESFINTHKIENRLNQKNFIVSNAKEIERLLDEVKICDPAIGSGAFPMGILNEIFHAKMALDMTLDRAEVKKGIIQNSIYGVDVEQGAVDIARLRFWLSLVVDEEAPQPLPNLDYKIMCGNSLLSRYALDLPFDDIFKNYNKEHKTKYSLTDYKAWVANYTNESDHDQKDIFKQKISEIKGAFQTVLSDKDKLELSKLKAKVYDLEKPLLIGERTKSEKSELKKLKAKLAKKEQERADVLDNKLYENAFEWRFEFPALLNEEGDFTGFDIVIGNPPYNEVRDLDELFQDAYKNNCKYYEYAKGGRLNLFQYFYPLAIHVSKTGGIVSLITQNSILGEQSALNNRNLFFNSTDILAINSFPERDNKKKRVFESVKMSVCICTLRKTLVPNTNHIFSVNVWYDKSMNNGHILKISKEKIKEIFSEELIIPICNNYNLNLLEKIYSCKEKKHIVATAGEVDMTKYKPLYSLIQDDYRIVTGAQVLRYRTTDQPSQGAVLYLSKRCLGNFSVNRIKEIEQERLVFQRITGVDSRIRIIGTLLEKNILCANSTNYISSIHNSDIKYILAVMNSKLINFTIKQTSTNTNITTSIINSLPIAETNDKKNFINLVDKILSAKQANPQADTTTWEREIDTMVYQLYNLTEEEIKIVEG